MFVDFFSWYVGVTNETVSDTIQVVHRHLPLICFTRIVIELLHSFFKRNESPHSLLFINTTTEAKNTNNAQSQPKIDHKTIIPLTHHNHLLNCTSNLLSIFTTFVSNYISQYQSDLSRIYPNGGPLQILIGIGIMKTSTGTGQLRTETTKFMTLSNITYVWLS